MTIHSTDSNPRIPFRLATDAPALAPLDGKRFLVNLAVNLEIWPITAQMPRALIPHPHGRNPLPDVANFSWVEYGLRCGLPRMVALFDRLGVPANNLMNAAFPDAYGAAFDMVQAAGWELTGHGLYQKSLHGEEDEAATIAAITDRYKALTGSIPRGWLGPGFGESWETPDLLQAAGYEYIREWMVDDQPLWMRAKGGPMLSLPYALDYNDVTVFPVERHGAQEYLSRFTDALDYYSEHEPERCKVITLALHPHVMGTGYRIGILARTIETLLARKDTVFVTSDAIADWFTAQVPAPASLT